jgi:protein involved in polysaccharide export with SLBB domain
VAAGHTCLGFAIDSLHMRFAQFGRRDKGGRRQPVCLRLQVRAAIIRFAFVLGFSSLPASAIWAQGTSTLDCADPMLAGTSACSNQTQMQLGSPSGNATISPGFPNNPANPNPQGNLPSSYADVEQLSRQTPAQPALLQPEPLTEFQKFVASGTGLILSVYGADLFRRIPSTFAPLDMVPVPPDYVVGPGDELRIRIWGQVSRQANVRVDRSGEIYLPDVGPVHVSGLQFGDLEAHVREAVGRVYHNFSLTVDLGQIRAIQVYVSGEARRPGVYTISSLSTLVDALFASGGPSVEGSMRAIELRRNGATVTRFDLYDLLIRGDKTKDAKLLSGDVIYIPPVGPQAAVFGSVRNPAIYELLPQESLSGVLADAGGASAVAAEARISIERIDEHSDRRAMEVAYDASGMATALADGDVIRVYSIVPRYQKTVTLRGNIANPGHFAWHQGMRLSDLIPDKDSLLTRNYWWRRAQMGLPAPEFEPIPGFANMLQPADNHPITLLQGPGVGPGQTGNAQDQYGGQGAEVLSDQSTLQNPNAFQQAQSGLGENQPPSAQQRPGSAPLAAAQTSAPSQMQAPAQRINVRLPAPDIDWDYAVIERLNPETLKTNLISFDLGKLVMQHDSSQDLELEAGDIVTIFSAADIQVPIAEQTKLVRLEGEFVHAGVYSVHAGETLRQLAERAGGLTPNAYLYGSEFTRGSARAIQQARIDDYVRSLSLAIQRSLVKIGASAAAFSSQGQTGGAAYQGGEQSFLASLQQIRATGRIVLPFKPASTGVDSIPDVALEDGDRFVVPHRPSLVNVIGAVYDQNSFLFADSSRVGTYLRKAGGVSNDADRRHEFVIRADGEVESRDATMGPWGPEFNNLRVNPGDTIVVPEKVPKLSPLYGIMNWSQMFSQLALGAASLSIIQ